MAALDDVRENYIASLDDLTDAQKDELRSCMDTGMMRARNMCGGRPSDAMRSEVWAHKNLGHDAYIAKHYETGTALRKLGY